MLANFVLVFALGVPSYGYFQSKAACEEARSLVLANNPHWQKNLVCVDSRK